MQPRRAVPLPFSSSGEGRVICRLAGGVQSSYVQQAHAAPIVEAADKSGNSDTGGALAYPPTSKVGDLSDSQTQNPAAQMSSLFSIPCYRLNRGIDRVSNLL